MSKIIIVIGAYGSGKSEYAINMAKECNRKNEVMLVDLDVVNPYFRSRDVREEFAKEGIDVIAPDGEYSHADLPMLSPRIMGAVQQYDKTVILDVGGDPAGCRTLARYVPNIVNRGYEMHLVINTKRPFTADQVEIENMIMMLESSSKLKVTHLICNTNLMQHTDTAIVEEGVKIVSSVAKATNLIFENYLVMQAFDAKIPDHLGGKKKKVLTYYLNKPWEMPVFRGI
ncbi:MAG: hypothetical protein J7K89_01290 [Candidatus Cloacimonetes bacterium]|nr:hypothetical protein [Candidatus Cloacimonadota bacterium]